MILFGKTCQTSGQLGPVSAWRATQLFRRISWGKENGREVLSNSKESLGFDICEKQNQIHRTSGYLLLSLLWFGYFCFLSWLFCALYLSKRQKMRLTLSGIWTAIGALPQCYLDKAIALNFTGSFGSGIRPERVRYDSQLA